jgi:hypothetical protein
MRRCLRPSAVASVLGSCVLGAALTLSTACRPTEPSDDDPGESFTITAGLTSNACAPGLDPIDPLVFTAALRREGSIAYWRIGEQPWVAGTLSRTGDFHFTVRTDVELYPPTRGTDPELDPGTLGCVVTMVESIDGRVVSLATDAGASDGSVEDAGQADDAGDAGPTETAVLEGVNRIELVPQSGTDCSRALLSAGGAFPTLPCAAEYDIEGVR